MHWDSSARASLPDDAAKALIIGVCHISVTCA
jgi:hypothetical protein